MPPSLLNKVTGVSRMRHSGPKRRGCERAPSLLGYFRRPAVAHGRHLDTKVTLLSQRRLLNKVTALSQRRDLAVNTMARAVRRITQTRHSEAK